MKQRDKRRGSCIGIAVLLSIALTGCQSYDRSTASEEVFIQEEEEIGMPQYKMIEVKRGNKKEKQLVECTLKSEKIENVMFQVAGIKYKAIYVKENDFVHKGDLIAELELSDLDEKLNDFEKNKVLKENEIAHTSKLLEFEKKKAVLVSEENERKEMQDNITDYENQIALQKKELQLIEKQVKVVKEEKEKRCIYAPMDGYVKNLITLNSYSLSEEKKVIARIFSPNVQFESINPVEQEVKVGQKVKFLINETNYEAEITGTESAVKGNRIFLKVLTDEEFKTGTLGRFTLIGQSFQDSLYVNEKAIIEVDGKPAVIRLDELGFKNFAQVETGLNFNGIIQILSGVKEGDQVVLE